jgi:hypothetical protein
LREACGGCCGCVSPRRRARRRGRAGQAPKLAPAARRAVAIGASVARRLPALARVAGASLSIHRLSIRRLAIAPLSVRLLEVRAQLRIGVVGARRRGRAGQAPKLAPVARRVLTLFLFDYISPSLPSGASPHPCVPGCACRALAVYEEPFRRGSWPRFAFDDFFLPPSHWGHTNTCPYTSLMRQS